MDVSFVVNIINNLISGAMKIGIPLAILFMIGAGIMLAMSGGNINTERMAKTAIRNCAIGVIIILAAKGLISMIQTAL